MTLLQPLRLLALVFLNQGRVHAIHCKLDSSSCEALDALAENTQVLLDCSGAYRENDSVSGAKCAVMPPGIACLYSCTDRSSSS